MSEPLRDAILAAYREAAEDTRPVIDGACWGLEQAPEPIPTHLLPAWRSHEWLGLGDHDRCAVCMVAWVESHNSCRPDSCPTCRHDRDRHGPEAGGCIECRCRDLLADFAESLGQMRRGEGAVLREKPEESS